MNDYFFINDKTPSKELNPYNEKNILISKEEILRILHNFGINNIKIKNLDYFIQAFTHKSYCKNKYIYSNNIKMKVNNSNNLELFTNSYERLEFLGDKVVKLSIGIYL